MSRVGSSQAAPQGPDPAERDRDPQRPGDDQRRVVRAQVEGEGEDAKREEAEQRGGGDHFPRGPLHQEVLAQHRPGLRHHPRVSGTS